MSGVPFYGIPEWHAFLREWNQEFLKEVEESKVDRGKLVATYPELKKPLQTSWLGEEAATQRQIQKVAARLGIEFADDYSAFLSVSNGWVAPGFESFSYMISPVEEVDLYARRNPESLAIHLEEADFYFTSGTVKGSMGADFLNRTIALCEQGQSVSILLDPAAEARAYWIVDFHDRARVFSTFTELIMHERSFCKESFSEVLAMLNLR